MKEPDGPKILIVEDSKPLLRLWEILCKKSLSCKVTTASSLKEAQRAMGYLKPNLIITDFYLGDGTASDLLTPAGNVKALVISGSQNTARDSLNKALKGSEIDYTLLKKPLKYAELCNQLKKFFPEEHIR